jgi:molecular chaperone DnaK
VNRAPSKLGDRSADQSARAQRDSSEVAPADDVIGSPKSSGERRVAYFLGIDIGTTYTAAAVWRDQRVDIAQLGSRTPVIPSVVLLREDGQLITGEAAERRAMVEPHRVARQFKRRFGDPTPIIVGGTPYSADALAARLARDVVDRVAHRELGQPDGVALVHPANWGSYKQDLLRQSIRLAELDGAALLTEPEAAAIHYASQERVEPGAIVAVYDLGGGTFDAAVLRRTETGWEILGRPEGVERLGGVDFDEAVFHHVVSAIGEPFEWLDPDDPVALASVTRLRQECVEAKEVLASDTDVTIPVLLPTTQTEVRLTRGEFETMIRPALGVSITAMHRALRSAGVTAADVSAVLLVGGSSRIPLVAEVVGSAFARPVAVDAHPKHGVALGAAIVAADHASPGAAVVSWVDQTTEDPTPSATFWAAPIPPAPPVVRPQPGLDPSRFQSAMRRDDATVIEPLDILSLGQPEPVEEAERRRRRATGLLVGGVVALGIALGAVLAFGRSGAERRAPTNTDSIPAHVAPEPQAGLTEDTPETSVPESTTTPPPPEVGGGVVDSLDSPSTTRRRSTPEGERPSPPTVPETTPTTMPPTTTTSTTTTTTSTTTTEPPPPTDPSGQP